MKKLLISLLLALTPSLAMALETLTSTQDLVDKTKTGTAAVVFTVPAEDPSWAQYKAAIEEYEKLNPEVKFYLAPMDNPEHMQMAMLLGISALPTTLFSQDGEVMTGAAGAPVNVDTLKDIIPKIQEAIKKEMERRKSSDEPKSKGSEPETIRTPLFKKQNHKETIQRPYNRGVTRYAIA